MNNEQSNPMTDNRLLTEQEIKAILNSQKYDALHGETNYEERLCEAQDTKTEPIVRAEERAACNKEWQEKVIKPFIKFLDETAFAYGAHEEMERLMRLMK